MTWSVVARESPNPVQSLTAQKLAINALGNSLPVFEVLANGILPPGILTPAISTTVVADLSDSMSLKRQMNALTGKAA